MIRRDVSAVHALVTAALVALALVVAAPADACQPTPCIEADPNPVLLGTGVDQGTTLVDWDSGTVPVPARVTVEVDGQEALFANAGMGQLSATVDRGKTYLYRLLAGEDLLASVTVEVKGKLVAGPARPQGPLVPVPSRPRAEQTSRLDVLLAPHGTYVGINARAPEPANITVFVSNNEPNGCETEGLDIVTVGAQGTHNYKTAHSLKVYNLEPSTSYFMLVKMRTEGGVLDCYTGHFTTRARRVTITAKSFEVFDDSDELSAGDLRWGLFVDPTFDLNLGSVSGFFPSSGEVFIDSHTGIVVDPPVVLDLGAVESAQFNVTGVDDDELDGGPGVLNECGNALIPVEGSWSTDCSDGNGKTVPLFFGPNGPGREERDEEFRVRVLGGALTYEAILQMKVTYQ